MQCNVNGTWCKRYQLMRVFPYVAIEFHWWKHRCKDAVLHFFVQFITLLTPGYQYSKHISFGIFHDWRLDEIRVYIHGLKSMLWEYSPHQLFFSREHSCHRCQSDVLISVQLHKRLLLHLIQGRKLLLVIGVPQGAVLFLPKHYLRKSLDNNYCNYYTSCLWVWQMDSILKCSAAIILRQIQLLLLLTWTD